jgi:hypothetical protein
VYNAFVFNDMTEVKTSYIITSLCLVFIILLTSCFHVKLIIKRSNRVTSQVSQVLTKIFVRTNWCLLETQFDLVLDYKNNIFIYFYVLTHKKINRIYLVLANYCYSMLCKCEYRRNMWQGYLHKIITTINVDT